VENVTADPDQATLQLDLSQEELLYVLSLAGVPTLPGLDDDARTDLDEDQMALLLAAGENGLRARGLLQDDPNAARGVSLWEGLLALVGTCVMAPRLAIVRFEPLGADAASFLYYFEEDLTVEHASGGPGVHRFTGFVDHGTVLDRIAVLTSLPSAVTESDGESPSGGLSGSVRSSVLEQARDIAVQDHKVAEAADRLRAGGVAPEVAEALAGSLGRLEAVATFAFLSRQGDEVESGGMVLLQEPQGLWLLEPGEQDDPLVECLLAAPATVRSRLQAALGPALGLENA